MKGIGRRSRDSSLPNKWERSEKLMFEAGIPMLRDSKAHPHIECRVDPIYIQV